MSDKLSDSGFKYGSFEDEPVDNKAGKPLDMDAWLDEGPDGRAGGNSAPSSRQQHIFSENEDPFSSSSGVEIMDDIEPSDESEIHLYKNFVCVVGKLHFKDTLKIKQGAFGDYAVFSLYVESPGRDRNRKYYLFIKAFDPRIVEWLKKQSNGCFIKIFGNLEAFNGSMYIKVRDIFPVMDVDQITNNVIGEPEMAEEENIVNLRHKIREIADDARDNIRIGDDIITGDDPWDSGVLALDNSVDADDLTDEEASLDAADEDITEPETSGESGMEEYRDRLRSLAENILAGNVEGDGLGAGDPFDTLSEEGDPDTFVKDPVSEEEGERLSKKIQTIFAEGQQAENVTDRDQKGGAPEPVRQPPRRAEDDHTAAPARPREPVQPQNTPPSEDPWGGNKPGGKKRFSDDW